MASKSSIAENVKSLMAEKGHTNLKRLAVEMNIPYSTLHAFLNGGQPTIKTLQAIASYYGVTLDFLVNGEDSKHAALGELLSEVLYDGLLKVRIERVIGSKKGQG